MREFESFLGYIDTLQEIDTAGVVPTAHPISLPTPTRPDQPEVAMDADRAVANAPEAAAIRLPRAQGDRHRGRRG